MRPPPTRARTYSSSRGIPKLRLAICDWYRRNYSVGIDADRQAIALIGSKEGLAHFVLMTVGPGDAVLCQDPGYPIHQYSVAIAGGTLHTFPTDGDFVAELERELPRLRPKLLIVSYPHNPTTRTATLPELERIVALAREHDVMVLHDFASRRSPSTVAARPASCRCPARTRWPSSSPRCRRATRWPAGGSALPAATRT